MYRRCLFCTADLGENEVIEPFPVGRRLAFDPARGRLWVICRQCERWNLSPLEERWEAVEEAERVYRDTPLRVATEHVGLARHREGLDLVRIGAPLRPEFAAWRYGDQFGRRRKRYVRNGVIGIGVVGGLAAGSAAVIGSLVGLNLALQAFNVGNLIWQRKAASYTTRIPRDGAEPLLLNMTHHGVARLRPRDGKQRGAAPVDPSAPWHLELQHSEGKALLTGQDAVRALRVILPRVNQSGASAASVKRAVQELEEVGGPEAYFAASEFRARKQGWGHMPLGGQPAPIRLALEMAAHEDTEREALEGELSWLETAWREAEEIAAIADDLTLPEKVRAHFDELKARHARHRPSPDWDALTPDG